MTAAGGCLFAAKAECATMIKKKGAMKMAYCTSCGRQIAEPAVYCSFCGARQTEPQTGGKTADGPNLLFNLLSFFIPLAGLVIWLSDKDRMPRRGASAGKWAIAGLAAGVLLSVLYTLFFLVLGFALLA